MHITLKPLAKILLAAFFCSKTQSVCYTEQELHRRVTMLAISSFILIFLYLIASLYTLE